MSNNIPEALHHLVREERERCLLSVAVGRKAAEEAIADAARLGTTPQQAGEFRAIADALKLAEERIVSGWAPGKARP